MEGLTKEESAFFESGGKTEVAAEETTAEATETVATETPKPAEVVTEKKEPSKFTYSKDTDNVVDDLGRKYVPLGAIQEARNENKGLRKQLEELETKWKGGEEKLNRLLQAVQGKQEEAPAYDKDPLGHLSAKNKALEEKIAALEGKTEQSSKQTEIEKQTAALDRAIMDSESRFTKENPDYSHAMMVVRDAWMAEYEEAGVEPEKLQDHVLFKARQFAFATLKRNQDPAQAIYKLANRLGYKKAEKTEEKDGSKQKETLKTIAKGQEAAKSLPSGKGSADLSLDTLVNASDEEMEEIVKDPKKWARLMKAA